MTKATKLGVGAVIALALSVPACEDEERACEYLGSECVGVPPEAVCGDDFCTEGVSCSEVIEVEDDGELQEAAARATPGACIALGEGSYGAVTVVGGVSLLGASADQVRVLSITVTPGAGTIVRGLEIEQGMVLQGATGVYVESVRISGGENGISAELGSSVRLARTTVRGVTLHGVVANGAHVSMDRSIIEDTGGPGVWAQCGNGAGCTDCIEKPQVDMDHVVVRRVKLLGLNLLSTRAMLRSVEIRNVSAYEFRDGGGMAASQCTELDIAGLHIEDTASFGMLLSNSSGKVGGGLDEHGIIIVNSRIGCWLDDIGVNGSQPLEIHGLAISKTKVVGLGFGVSSKGIIIVNSHIDDTKMDLVPVLDGGSEDVGDGLVWNEGVQADVQGLSISGSARHPVLIDGGVGANSKLTGLSLGGGDEAKGILQQRAPVDTVAPEVDSGTAIEQDPQVVSGVPEAPQPPQGASQGN